MDFLLFQITKNREEFCAKKPKKAKFWSVLGIKNYAEFLAK